MDRLEYLDFDIRLEKREQRYAVSVIRSPAGEAEGEFVLPFSDLELENLILKVGRTRRGVRHIGSPEWQAARAFGGKLFEAVFKGDVRGCFRSSLDKATLEDKGLRIKLRLLDAPELADLPWEYLYNRPLNRFLSLSAHTPIVRYIELPEPIRPLAVKPPLCILVMVSSPSDYAQLDVEREKANLQEALSGLEEHGMVKLEWLEEATLLALQRRLRRERYHIFHFIGHGEFDERAQDGLLLMEDQRGRGRRVSGQHLGVMLHDHRTLMLAILNACEGARSSRTDPFAGTAMTLVQQGIPAVVAMQFEITDEAAIAFASEFYAAIADGYPVDASLAEARKTIFATGNDVEWGTPVLYMRSPDGQIFGVEPPSEKEREALARAAREEEARLQAKLTAEEKKKRPKPTGVPKQIEALTRLMNIRRDTAEPPYVLVLGAGASLSSGCSSGARIIEDVVGQLSRKDVAALSWEEKIAEFYDLLDNLSPTERYTILKSHVVGQSPSPGYRHLAQLTKAGYFDIIFSTNFDVFLEDALSDAGLRARDFTVLVGSRESEEEIARVLGFSEPRVKLVKLHGDLPARIFAFTPEEIFQFSDKIEKVLKEYLSRDIIIVGHSMRDDDLNRCIRAQGGSIWYTNPAPPTVSDFVGRAIKVRRGSIISGEMGKFDDFFQALGEALLEAPSRAAREKETQRQAELSALYSKGTDALAERDWPTAIEQFKALLALDDSHQDAKSMLTEAQRRERERQEQLGNLYSEGIGATERSDWEAAIAAFKEVMTIDSKYRDVAARLAAAEAEQKEAEEAREREARLADLYSQAMQAKKAKSWAQVISTCEEIRTIDRRYKDVASLLKQARAEDKRERELVSLHGQIVKAQDDQDWDTVIALCEEIQAIDPSYRDVAAILQEAKRVKEVQEREERLTTLYDGAEERYHKGEWTQAAELYGQVLALEPGYRDAEEKLAEAQRQQQLADQYAHALEHLQAQRWQEAIKGFRAVLGVAPTYKDATTLLAKAKHQKELASLPEPPAAKPAPPRRRKPATLPK